MKVIEFKSCPKCGGDLFLEKDRWGEYLQCLQCGYTRELETVSIVLQPDKGLYR